MTGWRIRIGARMVLMGLQVAFGSGPKQKGDKMNAILAVLKTLWKTWGKAFAYAAAGAVGAYLVTTVPMFTPSDPTQLTIWKVVLAGALAGLGKILVRVSQWDQSKVGK